MPTKYIQRKNLLVPVHYSDQDFWLIIAYNWNISSNGYVYSKRQTSAGRETVLLHRLIMECPAELVVDHKDRNPLNNVRSNLIICTDRDNNLNVGKQQGTYSKYRGVTFDTTSNRWLARIKPTQENKTIHIGSFSSEELAAYMYDHYAKQYDFKVELNGVKL